MAILWSQCLNVQLNKVGRCEGSSLWVNPPPAVLDRCWMCSPRHYPLNSVVRTLCSLLCSWRNCCCCIISGSHERGWWMRGHGWWWECDIHSWRCWSAARCWWYLAWAKLCPHWRVAWRGVAFLGHHCSCRMVAQRHARHSLCNNCRACWNRGKGPSAAEDLVITVEMHQWPLASVNVQLQLEDEEDW